MAELEVKVVPVSRLTPYANNAKLHPHWQIDQIAESIEQFGNCDPIAVWTNEDGEYEIVEGHGRLMALQMLGVAEAPVIFLDHLTDEQRRAYALAHNQLTMNSDFDFELLQNELDMVCEIDMTDFGFTKLDPMSELDVDDSDFIQDTEVTKDRKKTIVCAHCGEVIEL